MQAHGNACKNFNAGLTHTETQTFVRAAFAAKKEKKKFLLVRLDWGNTHRMAMSIPILTISAYTRTILKVFIQLCQKKNFRNKCIDYNYLYTH